MVSIIFALKKMITLYLARHGQTEENMTRIFQGHMPGTLTVEGIAQAEALRDTLRDISLDAVVSSDLKRCVDTARIAVEGRNLPWEKMVLLREIDWGSWTGLAIKEVDLRHFPADVETEAMLYERAGRFVDYLKERYDGKQVLAQDGAVSHARSASCVSRVCPSSGSPPRRCRRR